MAQPFKYALVFVAFSVATSAAFLAGVQAERFAAADACLDAGGVVVQRGGFCKVEVAAESSTMSAEGEPPISSQ